MFQPFIDAALAACKEVAETIHNNQDNRGYQPHEIGAGGDISIGFDLEAESIFIKHLKPFGTILSEESGQIGTESDHVIILDPIDGSDNLKAKFPYYGASIAFQIDTVTKVGMVCNFATGECFVKANENHYVMTNFGEGEKEQVGSHPYSNIGLFEKAYEHPEMVRKLQEASLKFRSPGAVALSLAYAHYVKYVLFFGTMRSYDLEAGLYLCEGLHCYQDDEILIVSKDVTTYQQLLRLFRRSFSEHS